jgi:hypothetical protein
VEEVEVVESVKYNEKVSYEKVKQSSQRVSLNNLGKEFH